ncbi:DMT family transporter [Paenibacillus radicis (ex Gao et al. 2016)]|uniref:Transporter YvbV n=1 Tax=Paenibacillus radicis (ex Gao et al. 2016) TaxID=1737354 RepID=A0A917HA26_9BACL|nr:DMT family transporter [Paenibacillus radicis (ex Gao et al. 2016)]GGG72912.1 putative transporter YvbV [Paenibacillus radicis (ex Gao et al. 2016)]
MRILSSKTTLAILFLVLIWGLSWSIYKTALAYTPPLLFSGTRSLLGGLLLAIFLLPKRDKLKFRQNWHRYSISALFNAVLFYGVQSIGLIYLPGGLFSVLVYFQPVLIGLLAWMWLGERLSLLKITGLVIGFLGILAVSADGITGNVSLLGVSLALLTALSWALGVIYVKKESRHTDSMWMVAMQFIIGGIALIGVGSGTESWSSIVWNGPFILGLLYGATCGIPIAFVIYFKLMNTGDASKVAAFTFLVPLIAVLTGTVFMHEPFTYSLLVGLVLIIISIGCVNYSGKKQTQIAET